MVWFYCALGIIALVVAAIFFTALYYFNLAIRRDRKQENMGASALGKSPKLKYASQIQQATQWSLNQSWEHMFITSHDGLKLHARLLEHPQSRGILLMFHGFRSSAERDFNITIPHFYNECFSLLAVDMRAHGQSEGEYMSYGINEGLDCVLWTNRLEELYPNQKQLLYGLSMGSATVMYSANKGLSKNVAGIIADCGFSNPWDELCFAFKRKTKLPALPFVFFLNIIFKHYCRHDLRCSMTDSLRGASVPVLIIHGDRDVTIPLNMSQINFAACGSEKELVIIEGGEHCTSFFVQPNEYYDAANRLFNKAGVL